MATFSALTARVKEIVNDNTQVVLDNAGNYVNKAIRKIQERNNYRIMRTTATLTTTVSTRQISTLATSFSDIKEFRETPYILHGDGTTEYIAFAQARDQIIGAFDWTNSAEQGAPRALMWDDDDTIKVFPYPDGNSLNGDGEYRIVVPYWKYLPDLTGVETNWFSVNMSQAIEYYGAALAFYDNFDEGHGDRMMARFEREYRENRKVEKNSHFTESFTFNFRG